MSNNNPIDFYLELVYPNFVEYDDCVFLQFNEENYKGFMAQTKGDKRAVESVMNHRHISDLFPGDEPLEHELTIRVGRTLKELWSMKLTRDFPNRKFVVSFPEERFANIESYEVTFYQDR